MPMLRSIFTVMGDAGQTGPQGAVECGSGTGDGREWEEMGVRVG